MKEYKYHITIETEEPLTEDQLKDVLTHLRVSLPLYPELKNADRIRVMRDLTMDDIASVIEELKGK